MKKCIVLLSTVIKNAEKVVLTKLPSLNEIYLKRMAKNQHHTTKA